MKIAIFLPNITRSSGGAEVYGLYLAKALSSEHNILIITSKPKQSSYSVKNVYKKFGISDLKTYYFSRYFEGRRHSLLREYAEEKALNYSVKQIIRKIKPDLFINGNQYKLICVGCNKSICISHFPPKKYNMSILKRLDYEYAESYSLLVSNSEFGKYHLKRMYDKDAIVLYPPVVFLQDLPHN